MLLKVAGMWQSGLAKAESLLCEAAALVQLRGLDILKSLDVSVEAEPGCGLSGSLSQRSVPLSWGQEAFPFIHTF